MKNNNINKPYAIFTAILLAHLPLTQAVIANEQPMNEPAHHIYHVLKQKSLLDATRQIAQRSGITFKINPAVQADIIDRKLAAEDWNDAIVQLLKGYNFTTEKNQGKIKNVIITGENGGAKSSASFVQIHQNQPVALPEPYRNFKVGSVMPVEFPLAQMKATPIGKKITLDLPIGQYRINHDNLVKHADGSATWIGYLDEEGQGYRFYLSQGEAGLIGNLYTPDGVYNIDSVEGKTVIVDMKNTGLEDAGYEGDQAEVTQTPEIVKPSSQTADHSAHTAALLTSTGTTTTTTTSSASNLTNFKGPVVDVMVLYTTARQTAAYAKQRIQASVDMSNQAYIDSKINLRLRLVHTRPTSYIESNSNSIALSDLANDRGAFYGTAALRDKYGADLVMLFRPLYARTSGSCGITYVGFSNGSAANARYGYGTMNNGYSKDSLTSRYCDAKTFTHEIGHSFGNVHDREYSSFPGRYAYSYAWGVTGRFGTIMSYKGPSVMLFASPALSNKCAGSPCGYPAGDARASDQVRTMNYSAYELAKYRATKVATPVIY